MIRYIAWLAFASGMIAIFPVMKTRGSDGTDKQAIQISPKEDSRHDRNAQNHPANTESRIYRISAYCVCSQCTSPELARITVESGNRRTASGHRITKADYGRIVAAPKSYPFGTTLEIPGTGRVRVLDRGGAIKAAGDRVGKEVLKYDRLDLLCASHSEARAFGIQYLTVTINPE
jgi:3D (Asp-Asp-Asp) domain-containing protein